MVSLKVNFTHSDFNIQMCKNPEIEFCASVAKKQKWRRDSDHSIIRMFKIDSFTVRILKSEWGKFDKKNRFGGVQEMWGVGK